MSMFKSDQDKTPAQEDTRTAEEILQELVGDSGKYKSPAELAKGYANAQSFIDKLTSENEQLREQATKAKTTEEILEALRTKQNPPDKTPADQQPSQDKVDPQLDLNNLEETLLEKLKARIDGESQQQQNQRNQQEVLDALTKVYGDKRQEVFNSTAQRLGMTVEALENMAATSPAACKDLLGLKGQSSSASAAPASGDHRDTGNRGQVPPEGTRAHAEYLFATGQVDRQGKYALMQKYAVADKQLFDSVQSYKK